MITRQEACRNLTETLANLDLNDFRKEFAYLFTKGAVKYLVALHKQGLQ